MVLPPSAEGMLFDAVTMRPLALRASILLALSSLIAAILVFSLSVDSMIDINIWISLLGVQSIASYCSNIAFILSKSNRA